MNNQRGFTLIELLVVVLIIGILTAVALPQYTTAVEKSRVTEALALMSAISTSAERYRLQKDNWPDANSFNKLDIEVPQISGTTSYGGKNFTMTMGAPNNNASGTVFVVVATRNLNNANSRYVLKTILTENANGTVTTRRACTSDSSISTTDTAPGASTEAYKFCAAATNGNLNNF